MTDREKLDYCLMQLEFITQQKPKELTTENICKALGVCMGVAHGTLINIKEMGESDNE